MDSIGGGVQDDNNKWRKWRLRSFRSLETLFREARFLVEGNNVEELRVIDNLSFSVAKLMSIESQWEAMVLEGDILEKSYSNIGNSGSSKLYSLLPALLECKHSFRSRYKMYWTTWKSVCWK